MILMASSCFQKTILLKDKTIGTNSSLILPSLIFDAVVWSAARQLYPILLVAPRGCGHQVVDDVEVAQIAFCI